MNDLELLEYIKKTGRIPQEEEKKDSCIWATQYDPPYQNQEVK